MQGPLVILIFCSILFLYIHIYFHLKTSDDLEVYEIDKPSKDKLEEICDLRQPVVFNFDNPDFMNECKLQNLNKNYAAFDIKIRDTTDNDIKHELYLPLTLNSAIDLFNKDDSSLYFTEKNQDFLEETGKVKLYKFHDELIRPYLVSNCIYDIQSGSKNTTTPFRYNLNYRNYYLVNEGNVTIKMAPPKDYKYLYPIADYDNFEFRSQINVWDPAPEHKSNIAKIKMLEIKLIPGQIIYIPAYWWHSFKFSNGCTMSIFKYRTYMNTIAILPDIGRHLLQSQNIKHDVVRKMNDIMYVDSINSEEHHNDDPVQSIDTGPNPSSEINTIDKHKSV
jgi:hypothetical protein